MYGGTEAVVGEKKKIKRDNNGKRMEIQGEDSFRHREADNRESWEHGEIMKEKERRE